MARPLVNGRIFWVEYCGAGRIECKHIMMFIKKYVLQMAQTGEEVRTKQNS